MDKKRTVVIGLLGTQLDNRGKGTKRWERWRPSLDLCRLEDLVVDRFDLLSGRRHGGIARLLSSDIHEVSPETEVVHHTVDFGDPWEFEEVYSTLHDFARAYPFSPETEDYLVHITTGTHVAQICLFLLTESHYFPARLLQTGPPKRNRPGSAGEYAIIDLDLSKYDRIAQRFRMETHDDISLLKSGIATRNAAFNKLIERVEHVAANSSDPLLLTGATGAGKSQLARRIFELKRSRRLVAGALVEVNCATLRGDAAMSALFGHTKGAFTGALADRDGLLRKADGGMLFLDEVGELGADEQAMLLHAIEEKRFLPVGADQEAASDFQLICGTNRDLQAAVGDGSFREDLLSRINLWTFHLPPLCDRREDIEPNLAYELERFAERVGRAVTFNKEARTTFLGFAGSPEAAWSSNFRDLNGAVTRMATLAPGGRITEACAREEIARLRQAWGRPVSGGIVEHLLGAEAAAAIDRFDRVQLEDVLRVCGRSRSLSEAGRTLFAVSRGRKKCPNDADRLRKYLSRYGITWRQIQELVL